MAGLICEGASLGSHFTAVRTGLVSESEITFRLFSTFFIFSPFLVGGGVLCFGDNRHGQCGAPPPNDAMSDASKLVLLPNKVDRLPPVSEIHCGWSHCLAITSK